MLNWTTKLTKPQLSFAMPSKMLKIQLDHGPTVRIMHHLLFYPDGPASDSTMLTSNFCLDYIIPKPFSLFSFPFPCIHYTDEREMLAAEYECRLGFVKFVNIIQYHRYESESDTGTQERNQL